MRVLIVSLALGALASGLVAARYWYLSSAIRPVHFPAYQGKIEPVLTDDHKTFAILTMIDAITESSRLNSIAARWTAIAVVLGAFATLAGV